MEIIVDGVDNLKSAAKQLIDFAGDRKKWTFVGEIGAGKTTFIKELCELLGVSEKVTSPTFSLINEYIISSDQTSESLIHHIDLYRLENMEEAIDIGIEDYLYDPHYCFIEWPQLIQPILPDNTLEINIEIIDNSTRKIIFL